MKPASLTRDEVGRRLDYCASTGVFTWRSSNKPAGCQTGNGYLVIGINGRLYLAHRLAWLVVYGVMPHSSIDHVNRDRQDNRIANLRPATQSQNIANTLARCTSKSGIKGVSWCKSTNKWRATIVVSGRQKSLGRFISLEDAAEAYRGAAVAAFGDYARTSSLTSETPA